MLAVTFELKRLRHRMRIEQTRPACSIRDDLRRAAPDIMLVRWGLDRCTDGGDNAMERS
jgi:hypothetical protein